MFKHDSVICHTYFFSNLCPHPRIYCPLRESKLHRDTTVAVYKICHPAAKIKAWNPKFASSFLFKLPHLHCDTQVQYWSNDFLLWMWGINQALYSAHRIFLHAFHFLLSLMRKKKLKYKCLRYCSASPKPHVHNNFVKPSTATSTKKLTLQALYVLWRFAINFFAPKNDVKWQRRSRTIDEKIVHLSWIFHAAHVSFTLE